MTNVFVYHEDFNKYDLGTDHPLIGDKPRNALAFLRKQGLASCFDLRAPTPVSIEDLLRVHDPNYVKHVQYLSRTGGWLSADTPAPQGIFEIASLATGGTVAAVDALFSGSTLAINPLGGFHHASRGHSSGFCFFNDIAVAIEHLRVTRQLSRFLIIDLDVHHGNGTQDIYYDDPTVLNISMHQDGRTLYPGTGDVGSIGRGAGEGYSVNIPLPPGTNGASYLEAFDAIVPTLAKQFKPEVILYQSGVDSHHQDPLADLNLNYQTYYHLGRRVAAIADETCKKLAVLFGGGYNSASCIHAYYNIVCGLLGEQTYLTEDETKDADPEQVQQTIVDLKARLTQYWNL